MATGTQTNGNVGKATTATHEFSDSVNEVGRSVRKLAEETAAQARDIGSSAYSHLSEVGKEQAAKLEKQVQASPMTSLFAAAGIGFLLGAFFRR